jgi:hypothetical protein
MATPCALLQALAVEVPLELFLLLLLLPLLQPPGSPGGTATPCALLQALAVAVAVAVPLVAVAVALHHFFYLIRLCLDLVFVVLLVLEVHSAVW